MTSQGLESAPVMSGAQIMIEALHAEGVKYVFGYPGGAVLPIYDEIYKQKYFKHILVRHEQAAAHAADAYARTTDEVGVVLVTSGPGATNAVTGIATAYADSIPLVVFTGQVGTKLIGTDAFQEVDTVGITRPCVKHNFLVTDVRELADTIKKAFYLARSGRPGPVLIDIPKDVQCAKCPFVYPEVCDIPGYRPVLKGHPGQIKRALQVLLTAKRPVVYIGGGMNNPRAAELLARFVELTGFPVASTLMGLGALDAGSKLNLGMLGMHGTYEANMAMHNSDVVLALGARFDDRVIGNPRDFEGLPRTVVQVDVDPSSISKCVATHVPIVGDVRDVLSQMVEQLEATSTRSDSEALGKWIAQIEKWRAKRSLAYSAPEEMLSYFTTDGYYGALGLCKSNAEYDENLAKAAQAWNADEREPYTLAAIKASMELSYYIPLFDCGFSIVASPDVVGVEDVWAATYNYPLWKLSWAE